MTLYVAVMVVLVLLVLVPLLVWALRRARTSEVRADPHRVHSLASAQADIEVVRDYVLAKACVLLKVDLTADGLATQRVTEAAATAIQHLRFRETYDVHLPFLCADSNGPKHLQVELHRHEVAVLLGRRDR
ncbi:MAG TPA: Hsp70 family protein [Thermoanaerobaculia bacterium]|nr:Hsp70 family protein [Thermoanaerobaculia bacterium]